MKLKPAKPGYKGNKLSSQEAAQCGITATLSPISARAYFESGGMALAGSFISYAATASALAAEATAIGAASLAIGASAFIIGGAAAISLITLGGYTLISGKSPLNADQKSELEAITNLYGQFAFTTSAFFSSKYESSMFFAKTAKAASDIFKFSNSAYDSMTTSRALSAADMLFGLKDAQEAIGYFGTDFKKDFEKLLADSEAMLLFDSPNDTSTSSAFPDRSHLGDRPHGEVQDGESDDDVVNDDSDEADSNFF